MPRIRLSPSLTVFRHRAGEEPGNEARHTQACEPGAMIIREVATPGSHAVYAMICSPPGSHAVYAHAVYTMIGSLYVLSEWAVNFQSMIV